MNTIEVQLYGWDGTRSMRCATASQPIQQKTQHMALTQGGLQRLLQRMPHRWYNAAELVTELQQYGIQTHHAAVTEMLNQCDMETRTVGNWTEYRRSDTKASAVHRRSCFACIRELKPQMERRGITTAELWDSLKREYNVTSRSETGHPAVGFHQRNPPKRET